VRVTPDSDNPDRFTTGAVFHARPGRGGVAGLQESQRLELTVVSIRGDESFPIVAFRGVADRDAAESLAGYLLEVRSSALPNLADDEFYPFDLEGLEARTPDGVVVGRVTDAVESPAHAILIVGLADGGELMVPFVTAAVPVVDTTAGFLVIDPGFVESK
jgi:16S rRNA processing protein RimM